MTNDKHCQSCRCFDTSTKPHYDIRERTDLISTLQVRCQICLCAYLFDMCDDWERKVSELMDMHSKDVHNWKEGET